jgi:hypothetical protein
LRGGGNINQFKRHLQRNLQVSLLTVGAIKA